MRQRMLIGCAVLGIAACGSAVSSAGSSGSKGPARCGPAGAQTLIAGRQGRVYQVGADVFGCAFGAGHAHRLGAAGRSVSEPTVGPIAIAGRVVAYGSKRFGVDTSSAAVEVRQLTSGRSLHVFPAIAQPVGPESFETVGSVVVTSAGGVAWIGAAASGPPGHRSSVVEVLKVDASGQHLLDSGTGVDPSSLRLSGSRLTWRDGGASRQAELG